MTVSQLNPTPRFEARFRVTKKGIDHLSFVSGASAATQGLNGVALTCASSPDGQRPGIGAGFAGLIADVLRASDANGSAQIVQNHPGGLGFIATIAGAVSTATTIYMQDVVKPRVPEKYPDEPASPSRSLPQKKTPAKASEPETKKPLTLNRPKDLD
ncbi:MAG: hypothetical protein K2X66_10595 [Cyanobacteria bacterium]|nr:hypothetical protein [Cyanobacteriota bacterium]